MFPEEMGRYISASYVMAMWAIGLGHPNLETPKP